MRGSLLSLMSRTGRLLLGASLLAGGLLLNVPAAVAAEPGPLLAFAVRIAGDAGVGVGVRAATNGDQRNYSRVFRLDGVLGVASPVAADLVVGERHAVAGVRRIDSADGVVFG